MNDGRGQRQFTKIAIVGYTDHMRQAPFRNRAWEIWSLNDHYLDLTDVDFPDAEQRLRWFQLHEWIPRSIQHEAPQASALQRPDGPPAPRDPVNHTRWLDDASQRFPVYLLEAHPELPHARVLDMDAMNAYFDKHFTRKLRYWTNSISYMIGQAIMELAPNGVAVEGAEIGVFGVDMMVAGGSGSEYGWQRPSCEVFLGYAAGLGITVHLPAQCDLLASAFDYGSATGNKFRKKISGHMAELQRRHGGTAAQVNEGQRAMNQLEGAISTLEWIYHNWMPGDGLPNEGAIPMPNAHKKALVNVAGYTFEEGPDAEAESDHGVRPDQPGG